LQEGIREAEIVVHAKLNMQGWIAQIGVNHANSSRDTAGQHFRHVRRNPGAARAHFSAGQNHCARRIRTGCKKYLLHQCVDLFQTGLGEVGGQGWRGARRGRRRLGFVAPSRQIL
jgi:hypothetical protein